MANIFIQPEDVKMIVDLKFVLGGKKNDRHEKKSEESVSGVGETGVGVQTEESSERDVSTKVRG